VNPPSESDSFAVSFAKVLLTQGYAESVVPEAVKLSEGGNLVLTKADGMTISIVCIVDAESAPERRFALSQAEVVEIAKACRARYSGSVNRTKMPAVVEIVEVRQSVTPDDAQRLKPLRSRFGSIVSAYAVDLSQRTVTANAWSLVNPRLRMLKRLLASSPQDRARLAESRPPAALPLRGGKPFLTFALLAVLLAVFVAELVFPATPATGFWTPSVSTLVALGALAKPLVLGQGEWHRLLTAAFLHGGPVHLLFNGLALWMAGMVLEPLLGRAWLIALFFIGALGGSLMSLAINPPNIVSVGASGAIMALLAAATVVAFRLPDGAERNRVLQGLLRILIPSLIPLATVRSGTRVDFAAHLGGALIGFASGGALLALWPRASPRPRLQGAAAAVAVLGLAALGWSADKVRTGYTSYATERLLIPADQLPKTEDDLVSRAPRLVAAYPRDPRSRLFNALARLRARDLAGTEAELRLALGEKEILKTWFKRDLEVRLRTLLAQTLIEQHRVEDARLAVQPVCDAGPGGTAPERLKAMKLCP